MEDEFAGRRRRVDLFLQGHERDATFLEQLDHVQEFAQ